MTKQDQKRALRQTMRRLESQLSPRYKAQSSQKICAHLLAMPEYQASSTIFCFVGTAHEIDTRPILTHALESGKRVCVPLCTAPGIMELREIASLTDLSPGAYGIPEPDAARCPAVDTDEVDFAVLPCLPGRLGAAVPGKAAAPGDPPGAPRLPRSLGIDGNLPL